MFFFMFIFIFEIHATLLKGDVPSESVASSLVITIPTCDVSSSRMGLGITLNIGGTSFSSITFTITFISEQKN